MEQKYQQTFTIEITVNNIVSNKRIFEILQKKILKDFFLWNPIQNHYIYVVTLQLIISPQTVN